MIKALGRRVLSPFLGHPRCQGIFQAMVEVGLAGLNIGEGNDPRRSGERFVAEYVRARSAPAHGALTLFDVGANVGVYTRLLIDVFGPSAQIWAFEPAEGAFSSLASSLRGVRNANLVQLALSDASGSGVLYSPGIGSKLGSLHDVSERLQRVGLPVALVEPVALTTIDEFCEDKGIARVDLLKLDVEGHELSVLRGAHRMLEHGAIGAIQFEFGAANIDSRTYLRDYFSLLNPRYRLYRVLKNGLHPLPAYEEVLEAYKRATNYLAVERERR